jgi:hypothetical protein
MKATIDVPDDLYRRVKAKTALQGRAVREVTIELFQRWVNEPEPKPENDLQKNQRWLDEFLALAVSSEREGPTGREILEEGRNRLEPKT